MKRVRGVGALAAGMILGGCHLPFAPVVCTDELRSALVVHVVDARTGAAIGNGATVLVSGPSFRDSTMLSQDAQPYVAWEDRAKAGQYTVIVRKVGYVDYVNNDVRLTSDACHVHGETFDAPLTAR
jgi:hypothetical protein